MNSDGITVRAPDIYQLRMKLGMHQPMMAVNVSGNTLAPEIKVSINGEVRSFKKLRPALRFIRIQLDKSMKVPKKAGIVRQKLPALTPKPRRRRKGI